MPPHRDEPVSQADRAPLSAEMRAAAAAVAEVIGGRRLPDALQQPVVGLLPASRAPVRDMAYQVIRQRARLEAISATLNSRAPAPTLLALQWVAISQLLDPIRAEPIIVDQAVAAARGQGRGPAAAGAAGFINATLRRFLRERAALLDAVSADPVARHGYPRWWLSILQQAYPQDWPAIADAGNTQAPLVLRANRRRTDAAVLAASLAEAGIACRRVGPQALALERAQAVESIPGFAQGEWSVQDAGAQMAVELLDVADGQRVLDACAAPGGKTGHLLERADLDLLALDVDADRCRRIEANLARLGLPASGASVQVMAADAARPADWWDGRPFDRILLDAPCTASGIVRRHPDVRWLRRRGDIATLARQQRRLLEALWPLLGPGGKLLFVTCSVFPQEGREIIDGFLAHEASAERLPLEWAWPDGHREAIAHLLPRSGPEREHDGFFYALLTRRR